MSRANQPTLGAPGEERFGVEFATMAIATLVCAAVDKKENSGFYYLGDSAQGLAASAGGFKSFISFFFYTRAV